MKFLEKIKLNLIQLIIFILYTIAIFSLFNDYNHVFWISYLFTFIALFIQSMIVCYSFDKSNNSESFNVLPLIIIAISYFVIQIALSIFLIAYDFKGLNSSIVVQSILLGIFIIIELLLTQGKNHIESVEENTKKQMEFQTFMRKEVEILVNNFNNNDNNLKDVLNDLFEVVRYSNPVSSKKVLDLEEESLKYLAELKLEIDANNKEKVLNLANKIKNNFNEREILLK